MVRFLENGEKVVKGSLIYKKNFDEERDFEIFHFYLTTNQLVTVDFDLTRLKQIKPEVLVRLIDRAENLSMAFYFFLVLC